MTRMFAISGVSAAALACGAAAAPAIPSFAEREPEIDFPVCVGLARIEGGAVTEIPVSEAVLWDQQFDMLGDAVGNWVNFITVPAGDPAHALDDLRAKGMESGEDYLVVYEVAYDANEQAGPTAIDRLRIFPTFEGEARTDPARAAGAAVLLNVADGSMTGAASAITIDTEIETPAPGYFATGAAQAHAYNAVVTELAHEVETAFLSMMLKAGLPEPRNIFLEGDIGDLTAQQIIEQADRQIQAAYGQQAGDRGC